MTLLMLCGGRSQSSKNIWVVAGLYITPTQKYAHTDSMQELPAHSSIWSHYSPCIGSHLNQPD